MTSFNKKENSKFLKNPISYQGSKRMEIDKINLYTPDLNACDKVVDVFGGGGVVSLYFKQKFPDKTVIFNDLKTIQCKLFNLLKDKEKTKNLISKLEEYKYNKESYEKLHKEYFDGKEQDVLKYVILQHFAFRGILEKSRTMINFREKKSRSSYKSLLKYHEILDDKFIVMNYDFRKVLNKYKDDEKAFIYMDPPYLTTNCESYHPFTKKDLDHLIECFKNPNYKCKMMLHIEFVGYTYDKLKDYIKFYYHKRYSRSSKKAELSFPKAYTLIATNYDI